jgi:hypothetical protein
LLVNIPGAMALAGLGIRSLEDNLLCPVLSTIFWGLTAVGVEWLAFRFRKPATLSPLPPIRRIVGQLDPSHETLPPPFVCFVVVNP